MLRDKSSGQRDLIARLEIDVEAAIAEQHAIDAKLEQLREDHIEKTDTFNNVQASYYGLGADISRLEQSIEHCEQRARQLAADIAETGRNAIESSQHLVDDRSKLEGWRTELAVIEPEYEDLSQSESLSSAALATAEAAMQDWQHRWDEFNQNAAEPQKNAEIQRTRIDQIEESLTGLSSRMERLTKERSELDGQDHTAPLAEQQSAVLAGQKRVSELEEAIQQCNAQIAQSRAQLKDTGIRA